METDIAYDDKVAAPAVIDDPHFIDNVKIKTIGERFDAHVPTDKYVILGKLAWLWSNSPLHRCWTIDLLSKFVLPAIELNQYALLERDNIPVAYCSWAFLNGQAEINYIKDSSHIPLADWNVGDRLWFVDWVAPFSAGDSWQLKRAMDAKFSDRVARAIRVKEGSNVARVMEFKGSDIAWKNGRQMLSDYYDAFLSGVQKSRSERSGRS